MTDQSEPILTVDNAHALRIIRERHERFDAEYREHMTAVMVVFHSAGLQRRRFDPRRLGDRFVASACRGWITRSERAGAAAQAKREATP